MQTALTRRRLVQLTPAALASAWVPFGVSPAFAQEAGTAVAQDGGTLTRAWEFSIKDFNPLTYLSTVQELVFQYSLDKLISWNEDLSAQIPGLAASWEVSEDGLTYTFHLQNGVTWQNGQPFSADDVLFTYQLALNPATTSKFAVELAGVQGASEYASGAAATVAGITNPDPATVTIQLTAVNPLFLNTVSRICILPKHVLESVAPADFAKSDYVTKNIVGTGAYQMVDFVPDQYVQWKANATHFRGKPHIDEVVLKFLDASVLPAALQNGELDLSTVAPVDAETVAANSELTVQQAPTNVIVSLFFNTQTIADVRVRQAIVHAIDRETMIKKNILHPAASAVPADSFLSYPWLGLSPNLQTYPYDPDKAKALLAEAGWDANRELTFLTYESVEPTIVAYQQYLAEVGIKTSINKVDVSVFGEVFYTNHEFDLAFGGAGIGLDPNDTSARFETGAQYNAGSYSNAEADALYAAGRTATSQEERIATYLRLQEILNAELPAAALGIAAVNWAVKNTVHEALFPQYADSINYIHPEQWWIG